MMKNKLIKITKESGKNMYSLTSGDKNENTINFHYAIDTESSLLIALSEIIRALENVQANDFSFSFQYEKLTERNIPVINLIPNLSTGKKLPLLVLVHGLRTSKEKVLRYAVHFAAAGFYTVILDLPDHGERLAPDFDLKYNSDNHSIQGWKNWLKLLNLSFQDVKILIDLYTDRPEIDSHRLGISGISMGATVALLTAYLNPSIKTAVSFLSIQGYEFSFNPEEVKQIPKKEIDQIRMLDPLFVYQKKPNAAILTQYGADDDFTKSVSLKKFEALMTSLYSSSPEQFKMIKHPDIGHDINPAMIYEALIWFKKYL